MGHVVFLRAANVGGRNVFRPARLARDLAHLDVVSVGAAGTFVVQGKASATRIRREIVERLPFEPALAVVPAREVLALVHGAPFAGVGFSKDRRGWVAVLDRRPPRPLEGPVFAPGRKAWSVRLDRVEGRFALGMWRRRAGGFVLPSQVVEKAAGVPATTRWWETIERVAAVVEGGERVIIGMKNCFGNLPTTVYGDHVPEDAPLEAPSSGQSAVFHVGSRQPPQIASAEIDPGSPRDQGYRIPQVVVDICAARPIDLALIDGIETMGGSEGPPFIRSRLRRRPRADGAQGS